MKLKKANRLAESLITELSPLCDRIIIGGSIRREQKEVNDIEIIAIPKNRDTLYQWAFNQTKLKWIKPNTHEIIEWFPEKQGRYWRGLIELKNDQIKVDLFWTVPESWGVIATIRTGSAEFNQALLTLIKYRTKYRVKDRNLIIEETGEPLPCLEEEDFFNRVGIKFVPITQRNSSNPYNLLHWK